MLTKALLTGLLALSAAVPLTTAVTTPSALPNTAPSSRLAGTWEIAGVPDPVYGIPPFVNVSSIGFDGAVVNVDPEVGTGVGESLRTGPNTYTAGFFGYLDAGGPATYEVSSTLTLTGPDTFSGLFRTEVFDLNGLPLFDYKGTISGTRLSAQPY